MAAMMNTALLELPHRLWNLFVLRNSSSSNIKTSKETIIEQGSNRKLSFASEFVSEGPRKNILEDEFEPLFQDYMMPKRDIEDYQDGDAFDEEDHSEDLSDIETKKENLWDESQLEQYEHVTANDEGFEEWSPQELDFFNSLNDRGLTAMLWTYWKVDFPTLPVNLFTEEKDDALIKNWKGPPTHGN